MKILNFIPFFDFKNFKNAEILNISPFNEKSGRTVKCEVGSINYVLAMICERFYDDSFFHSLDIGFLSGECNVGEEEIDEISDFLKGTEILVIDENTLKFHTDRQNIENFLAILKQKFSLKILNQNEDEISLKKTEFNELKELENFDGSVVFEHVKNLDFVGGKYFAMVAKIANGDEVEIKTKNFSVRRIFKLDENLKGTIALLGVNEIKNYNFETAKISKV